jgi:hypothetical protein
MFIFYSYLIYYDEGLMGGGGRRWNCYADVWSGSHDRRIKTETFVILSIKAKNFVCLLLTEFLSSL